MAEAFKVRRLLCFGVIFALSCAAQSGSAWRFWDTGDGFVESYTSSTALARDGAVWVKHGYLGNVDRLDGYFAPHYKEPHKSGELVISPGGALWMWAGGEIMRFLGGAWMSWPVPAVADFGTSRGNSRESWDIVSRSSPFLQGTVSVAAVDNEHALILLPDRVLEFDARQASASTVLLLPQCGLRRFVNMTAGLNGGVIVTGYGGWGRLIRDAKGVWVWKSLPRPPARYVEFDYPLELAGQELFLTGITSGATAEALSFNGHHWTELYQGDGRIVRAWPGENGVIWVQNGNHLLEGSGGAWHDAEKGPVLSGIVINVNPEGAGRFWISTSQGLGHSTPALWRNPPEAPRLDDVVNSIAEDRSGSVWFLEAHSLIRYDNSRWTTWQLPTNETSWAIFTDGLQSLPDGRMVIRVTGAHLLIFDPANGTFKAFRHPGGKIIRMLASGPGGQTVAETFRPDSKDSAIETFDGKTFNKVPGSDNLGHGGDLRAVRMEPNGDIFTGSTSAFTWWHDGKLNRIQASDGFTDPGAYYIHRSPDGHIFAGGRDGLFELVSSRWRLIRGGLDRVRKVITSRDGTLWVASGNGVHRYQDGNWISNGEPEGLASDVAYSVFEDSRGRIWAGTTRGISLFNPKADRDPPLVSFDEDQNPREAPPDGKVRLVFSGIDKWKITPASRLLYSWRMDGGVWSAFAGRDSQSFDRLRSGRHRFEVRAMDRNGNISLAPAVHGFSVLVPWYATSGFISLASLALLLIVVFFSAAVTSYRQRGRLIQELNTKHKLERDRQKILQMIAGRDSLSLILSEIAGAVAENCAGATCLLTGVLDGVLEAHCYPPPSEEMKTTLMVEIHSGLRDLNEWRHRIIAATAGRFASDVLVMPVSNGQPAETAIDANVSFFIALLRNGRGSISESDKWVVETFAGLAAGAIENNRLYRQLAYQANHDSLTGLPNRACFDAELASLVKDPGLPGSEFALLYLDLDRFKQINDTLGHRVGDLFLKHVSSRLSGALQSAGRLFRIGGDEFIVLAPSTEGRKPIQDLAAALLSSLSDPAAIAGYKLFASASIGVSFFREHGDSPSVLLKNADIAMYCAKAKGRNGFELFVPEMVSRTEAAHGIEELLRSADAEGRFRLFYQPRFTTTGPAVGFEAKLRLLHPERGVVDAAEFVNVADESGLIVPIGKWVLREACRQLAAWRSEGLRETWISITMSQQELSRPSCATDVESALAETRVPARLIRIACAESTPVTNSEECVKQMDRLRTLGISLTVNDLEPFSGLPVPAASAREFLQSPIPEFGYLAGAEMQTDSSLSIASEQCAPVTS